MFKSALDKVKNLLNKSVATGSQVISHVVPAQATVVPAQSAAVVPAQVQAQAYLNQFGESYLKYKNLFVEKAITGVNIPPIDHISAQVAFFSYSEVDKRPKVLDEIYFLDEKNSTRTSVVYFDPKGKRCIIGYRGTVIRDVKDVISDAQMVLDVQGIDPRIKDALNTYDTIRREYQGCAIWICGHSLGGTISYIVGKHRNPDRCVAFNPGASLNTFFMQMLQDTFKHAPWAEKTYTYKIFGDIISTFGFVGHTKTFSIQEVEPLKLHTIENFIH